MQAPPFDPYRLDYQAAAQRQSDVSNLTVLSICHYVFAAFQGFAALGGLVYIVMGAFMIADSGSAPDAAIGGVVFLVIGLLAGFMALATAVLSVIAGISLARRKRRVFCFIVAALACMSMPLGTILGIFTIIILTKKSVEALFAENAV
jgi:hypothetical protein